MNMYTKRHIELTYLFTLHKTVDGGDERGLCDCHKRVGLLKMHFLRQEWETGLSCDVHRERRMGARRRQLSHSLHMRHLMREFVLHYLFQHERIVLLIEMVLSCGVLNYMSGHIRRFPFHYLLQHETTLGIESFVKLLRVELFCVCMASSVGDEMTLAHKVFGAEVTLKRSLLRHPFLVRTLMEK